MKRRLFCEICPFTFWLSRQKGILLRKLKDAFSRFKFCKKKDTVPLPEQVGRHTSPICRHLAGINAELQQNKATNLALALPHLNGILIRPRETFSLWRLVGNTSKRKGYLPGLIIACGNTQAGTGGGMCQLSNLLHWLVLHSELSITEHHHHERFNLFPDADRRVPFGLGTSIAYNYLDYRVTNNTERTYQFLLSIEEGQLIGELRATEAETQRYAIRMENDCFVRETDGIYRLGDIYRDTFSTDGHLLRTEHLRSNHAKVMYDVAPELLSSTAVQAPSQETEKS